MIVGNLDFIALSGDLRRFPRFNHRHHILNFPKAGVDASGLGRAHFVSAADFHEIMVHRMKGEGVNVVFQFLAESLRKTRITLAMLADYAVVPFNVRR